MKKAGIYDRWLHTLGGGEQHTVALAQALARSGYSVEILTHRPTNTDELKTKFGISRLNFSIRYLPELWDYQITPYTKEYDLFVLSSFADMFKSEAKKSILSVFFPIELKLNLFKYITRVLVVPAMRKLFQFPLYIQNDANTLITIATNKQTKKTTVHLHFPQLALSVVEQLEVTCQETGVQIQTRVRVLHKKNTVELQLSSKKKFRQFQIVLPESKYTRGVTVSLKSSLWNTVGQFIIGIVPAWKQRFSAGPRKFAITELTSYDKIIANSNYTAKWIKNYWNLNSQVVYPPVETTNFSSAKNKKKWIVSTGRFFIGGHNKKQLEMVEAFKKLSPQNPEWELHLIGSVNDALTHKNYFETVVAASKGYPIVIHENIPFTQLQNILSQSSMYWHASGLDVNEADAPDKIEHFGLTIIEAMASGCVPVVINKGGPIEIVSNSGVTWNTVEELINSTQELISNPKKLEEYRKKSIEASKLYSTQSFENKLNEILKSV